MKIEKAVNILKVFNRWRRGEDIEPMIRPRDIGIAIDTVVNHLDKDVTQPIPCTCCGKISCSGGCL